jgi:SNF2 family DNA or RNA helicase
MIGKDSVEEKILALQLRKKMIADDLISEDTGFVKKLTAEDVDFLFS